MKSQTESLWVSTATVPKFAPLNSDFNCNICVIGAGISGLTTAYCLALEGKSVVVLDDGPIGGGETARSSAQWVTALDHRYSEIEKLHGTDGAALAAESHARAIDFAESIVSRERIDCNFARVNGYLIPHPHADPKELKDEFDSTRRIGLSAVEWVDHAPGISRTPHPALLFPRQAQCHPVKYLNGLALAAARLGVKIFCYTRVADIKPFEVKTALGSKVRAEFIVVATNSPVCDLVTMHTKQAAYRTYVSTFRIPRYSIPKVLIWDTFDPFHYVRIQNDNISPDFDVLIVGGEDHKTGQGKDPRIHFDALEIWTRDNFPMAGPAIANWSGQIMESVDGLGYIGRNPGNTNVFIVTGDSGNGLTHGTLGARLITDLIFGRANPYADLYDPARKNLKSAREYFRENMNTGMQYADWLNPADVKSVSDIQPGTGAVLREGMKPVAVYKNEYGHVQRLSAVCPHLGGIVNWNTVENSWDCPCHGSRFDASGKVLNGPAISDLKPIMNETAEPARPPTYRAPEEKANREV